MGLITETNQQYYQGAQGFLSATGAINETFPTTFDTDLIFGDWNPANANYALNNFKVYTSNWVATNLYRILISLHCCK